MNNGKIVGEEDLHKISTIFTNKEHGAAWAMFRVCRWRGCGNERGAIAELLVLNAPGTASSWTRLASNIS
jgi:hypothetical protein